MTAVVSQNALDVACCTPKTIKKIKDSNHRPNSVNLATEPIDFKLVINILRPKYIKKNKGIAPKKKVHTTTNHKGVLVASTNSYRFKGPTCTLSKTPAVNRATSIANKPMPPARINSIPMNFPKILKKNMMISPIVSKKVLLLLFTLWPTFS